MAKANMSKSIGNRECGWVRARLPLWVDQGVAEEQSEAIGDGRDLSAKDSRVITQHLSECARCRQHRLDLEQALGALAAAAAHLPVIPEAPSLWPELERRIANPHASDGAHGPQGMDRAVRSLRSWSELDGDRPIRQAWTRDTIGELLASRSLRGSKSKPATDLILRLSVAATILIGFIQFQILHRRLVEAEATITANRASLGELIVPLTTSEEPLPEIADRDKNDVPRNQLAEADLPRPRPAESPAAAVETAPIRKSSAPTRFGFDLDHGTPMPPDSRETKAVY
jgi:hypothetical protein